MPLWTDLAPPATTVQFAEAQAIIARGRDTHGHVKEFDVTQRFAYDVTRDLQLSLAQGFRSLYMKEIEDPDMLGRVFERLKERVKRAF